MEDSMAQNAINENLVDKSNISKVANVQVALCAELGRAKLSLKEAIEYDTGSIITLDKINDEPIEIYVDDILIAKAKIVAIEDSYGIKITEIIENKNLNAK